MGTADLVPGVSGGTVAFISGIYEELLATIQTLTGTTLKLLYKLRLRQAFASVSFGFVLPLGLGILTAVFFLAGLLTYLLVAYPTRVWAFFFGLVAASTYIVAKRVIRWDWHDYAAFGAAAVFAYVLVGSEALSLPHNNFITFLSGAIAICAMILPGISGSFILVLLGQYSHILSSVSEHKFATLFIFLLGTIAGISVFSRFLSWLFKKHHDISVAVLSGFMLGSLRKIWPFAENSMGVYANGLTWVLIILGAAIVFVLTRYHFLAERTEDLKSRQFKREHAAALESQK